MSKDYNNKMRERVIQQFVEEHDRSPNELELKLEMRKTRREYPQLEQVGFSRRDIEKPQYASISSAGDENKNRAAITDDLAVTDDRIIRLFTDMERSFRTLYASTRQTRNRLDDLEARVDNLLLLNGQTDVFVYGFEENFTTNEVIDLHNSTASVENGYVTMGRDGMGWIEPSRLTLSYSTISDKGYIGFQNTSDIETLSSDNGEFWEHLVYTSYKRGRVSLLIDVTLDEPTYVNEIRFTTYTLGTHSRIKATVFYSFDGDTYKSVEPQEVVLTREENVFHIGLDQVKKVRLMLSKDSFDDVTSLNNQYAYLFGLDSLKLFSKTYSAGESVLYAGPYEIMDESGNDVFFTKATADVCVIQGDEENVSLYLSADGETYVPVDHQNDGNNLVSFQNGSGAGTEVLLELGEHGGSLVETDRISLGPSEAALNTAVDAEYAGVFVQKSVILKRNIPVTDAGVRRTLQGIDTGWFYDKKKRLYRTTIYNTNDTSIDLGHTSAYLNGLQVSGQVFIPAGYSVFETAETNYQVISPGIKRLAYLKKEDSLYPYNHKYLIEGYVYADQFKGERLYPGMEEYFGELMKHVPLEIFSSVEMDGNYRVFSMDDSYGDVLFKVKIDRSSASWADERFSVGWSVGRGSFHQLWLKMLLHSKTNQTSAVVNQIKVRVI